MPKSAPKKGSKPSEGAWKKVDDSAEKFSFGAKGESLEGRLISIGKSEFGYVYNLKQESGERVYFFGSAVLDRLLPEQVGKDVRIVYEGDQKLKGGRTLKQFSVYSREAEETVEAPF